MVHESEKVLVRIPEDWAKELEGIYRATEMSQIEGFPFYNSWNPPSRWIEENERLDTNNLEKFLHFLDKEGLNGDRYSFEKFAGSDWRVKIGSYDKLVPFHEEVEKLLIKKAEENGCWSTPLIVTMKPRGEVSHRFIKLGFPTPKEAFPLRPKDFRERG